jgi:ketosteroid isomerase-like protein
VEGENVGEHRRHAKGLRRLRARGHGHRAVHLGGGHRLAGRGRAPAPGGHFNGADEVLGILAKLPEHYDELSVSPDEYLEDGDTVIAVGHISAQAKSSGEQFETPFAHVWRMKDAKVNQALIIEDSAVIARSLGV